MSNGLSWIALFGAILFTLSALFSLWAHFKRKETLRNPGLYAVTLLGPITLGICWKAQSQMMLDNAVVWGRLMAGDVAGIWRIGSLGLIAGTGLALGALSLIDRAKGIFPGAIALALLWIVLFLHPTPHYVPIPAWLDKLVWFGALVGGAAVCLVIYLKFQSHLAIFKTPMILMAGVFPLLAAGYPVALISVSSPVDLASLVPEAQIEAIGCLACHSMNGIGYPVPGEGLESVASRKEDTIKAFLAEPTAENAKTFGIRANPTGLMVGVHLSDAEVNTLTEALKSLFALQPPSKLGPGWERVETVLAEKTCLACHSLKDEGAPQGGIGGALENSSKLPKEVLVEWLLKPSAENAVKLKIRETAMGAMESFALPQEQADEVAAWLKSLGNN